MNVDQTISDLASLSVSERLRVVQAIWDTLPSDPDVGVSIEQQRELDRRLQAHRDDPSTAVDHDEIVRRVEERL